MTKHLTLTYTYKLNTLLVKFRLNTSDEYRSYCNKRGKANALNTRVFFYYCSFKYVVIGLVSPHIKIFGKSEAVGAVCQMRT